MQLAVSTRNSILDGMENEIGATPVLKLRTGAAPANVATADSGTVLATLTLPSDWLNAASGGTKTKNGTWEGSAGTTGTWGHWRLYASDGVTAKQQGPTSELTISTSLTASQNIRITAVTYTAGNA